jgi:organic radical activating enzyme
MRRTGYISEMFCSFQGEGAAVGRRHLFLRTAGCHLRCRYCDTPDSLERTAVMTVRNRAGDSSAVPNPLTVEQVIAAVVGLVETDGPIDGVALTGGEPLLQADFLADLLASRAIPHPRLLETSGTHPERLAGILPLVDIVSMDIKLPSNSGERALWAEHERFLRLAGDKAYVKILVDAATDPSEVERAARLVQTTTPTARVFLQPITGQDGAVDIERRRLDLFFDGARRYLTDVSVLPQVHKLLRIP